MLADFLTMHEASGKPYDAIGYAFAGDCRFNMGRSLLVMGALMGQRRPPCWAGRAAPAQGCGGPRTRGRGTDRRTHHDY
jgi:hypothetical protein